MGEQHVFYRGTDGSIQQILWRDGDLSVDNWTTHAKAPLAAGDPAAMVWDNQPHIFYCGTDGSIQHIWRTDARRTFGIMIQSLHNDSWTTLVGAPAGVGKPATMSWRPWLATDEQHIFYRAAADGSIQHVLTDGSLHTDNWTRAAGAPAAAGDPATMVWTIEIESSMLIVNPPGSGRGMYGVDPHHIIKWIKPREQHIVYRGHDGSIEHILWDKSSFHYDNWTALTGAPAAAGNPSTLIWPREMRTWEQHVFYRDVNGSIQHIVWDDSLHLDNWTQAASAPLAAGDPVVFVSGNQQHIFYRGLDGSIQHVWYDLSSKAFYAQNWTQDAGAPAAAGEPAAMLSPGQQHIFYRAGDGSIQHIWWDGSRLNCVDWTRAAGGPAAAGDPAAVSIY